MTTREMTDIMLAFANGEVIESKLKYDSVWTKNSSPTWNWSEVDYRVKPKPEVRPYKDAQEFLDAQERHGSYVTNKGLAYFLPVVVLPTQVKLNEFMVAYEELSREYWWQDGAPCGVMEE